MKKFLLYLMFFLVFISSGNSITFSNINDILKVNSVDYIVEDEQYFVLLNIDVFDYRKFAINFEVINIDSNLVVKNYYDSCSSNCVVKIPLNNIYFGKHKISLTTSIGRESFRGEYFLDIDFIEDVGYNLKVPKIIYITEDTKKISIPIKVSSDELSSFLFEVYPSTLTENRVYNDFDCVGLCNFNFELEAPFLIDDYIINSYSSLGEVQIKFEFKFLDDKSNDDNLNEILNDNSELNSSIELNEKSRVKSKIKIDKHDNNILFNNSKKGVDKNLIRIEEIKIDGSKIISKIKKREVDNYLFSNDTLSVISLEDDSVRINLKQDLKSKEKVLIDSEKNDILKLTLLSKGENIILNNDTLNLKPGIYKEELKNGTVKYFAYGLITINSEKPLYNVGDVIKFIIVVLDSNGFLVSSANISLNVELPNGFNEILSTSSRSIVESKKNGVYFGFLKADEVGKYNISIQTQVNNFIVSYDSYVNVVLQVPVNILREVPATIDPWQGPFKNTFNVSVNLDNITNFDLFETLPVDFDITSSNAHEIQKTGGSLVLKWFNITSVFSPFYFAASPLITPYLYELGKAEVVTSLFNFFENRSWILAIDPIVDNAGSNTCSVTFGNDCSLWPSTSELDNTFDTCPNSIGGAADEHVNEVLVSKSQTFVNSQVNVTCTFDPYSTGSEEYIYYYNSTGWRQIYSGNPVDGNIHDVTQLVTIDNVIGNHYFRCIIDWDGENDFCANAGSYYDNDDVLVKVIPVFLTLNSPVNIAYPSSLVNLNITTTSLANITYKIDGGNLKSACDNCNSYSNDVVFTKDNHTIEVFAVDVLNGNSNTWIEDFEVLSDQVNPVSDPNANTCSNTFGAFCGLWPSTSEGDNTFDTCPNSIGGTADENVYEAEVNMSLAYTLTDVNVTCTFDPYSSGTEEYIYYYNSSGWRQIYAGNPIDGNVHNISAVVTLDNITGTHYFRCIADWDGENDECANGGSYYDNDDVKIDVLREVVVPFEVIISNPKNQVYNYSLIDIEFTTTKNSTIEYRYGNDSFITSCISCTNYQRQDLLRNGDYTLQIKATDDVTSEIKFDIVSFVVNKTIATTTINSTGRTCSESFGASCGLWPSSSEGDNTFDMCSNSIGGSADENVFEAQVNMSVAYPLTDVNVTCTFDPYSSGTEEYIYYYNSSGWRQIYAGNPVDGNVHSVSSTVILDNITGVHWFRCIADWDGENDECADVGSYYDNDDVDILVIEDIIIPFTMSVFNPQNVTFTSNDIPFDVLLSKNANISYSLNDALFTPICNNCSDFISSFLVSNTNNKIIIEAVDFETSEVINDTIYFTYQKNYNITSSLFDGVSTDFSAVLDLNNACNVKLEKTNFGKIEFDNCLSADNVNLDENVFISQNFIGLDSNIISNYNISANLTFYNLSIIQPIILVDGNVCSNCSILSNIGSNIKIQVPHFSNYTIIENRSLSIFDDSDFSTKYKFETVNFFANYTENNLSISDASCSISFDSLTGFSNFSNMTYNVLSELYTISKSFNYNGSYQYNVSCSHSSFPTLEVIDFYNISAFPISTGYINITNPLTSNPESVVDSQNYTISFQVFNNSGSEIKSNVYIDYVDVGGVSSQIKTLSPLSFNSSISVAAQMTTPLGIAVYGDKLWVTSNDLDSVLEYFVNGTLINQYDISAQSKKPRGITTIDGSEFWVVDDAGPNPDDVILHYDSNFNYLDSFSVATQTTTPYGMTTDGVNFYIVNDVAPDSILIYDMLGNYISSIDVSAYSTSTRGITISNDDLWIIDNAGSNPDDQINHFKTNGSYVDTFSISAQTGVPTGIATKNGKQFYVVDNTNDRILIYSEENTRYNVDHFEVDVVLPVGLEFLQDIKMSAFVSNSDEFTAIAIEPQSLQFPEKTPPGLISNLQNITTRARDIFFTWTNPVDSDFNLTLIYVDGVNIINLTTPQNYYNLTGLLPETVYNFSVQTMDVNNNININFVSKSVLTTSVPLVVLIEPIPFSQYLQNSNVSIKANVTSNVLLSSVEALVSWSSGSVIVDLFDLNNDSIYENNFTSTVDFGIYNLTIIATNILGDFDDSINESFEIISDTPFMDTYTSDNNPDTNYGSNTRLRTDSIGDIRQIYLQFDINSLIPQGVRVDSAFMDLYVNRIVGSIVHDVFYVNQSWNETGITFNNAPTHSTNIWASTTVDTVNVWASWNLTELTKNWYNNSIENFGITIFENTLATNGVFRYKSSNSGTNIPKLIVNYTDITAPVVDNLLPQNVVYEIGDDVSISVQVVDNILVDKVMANISYGNNFDLVELVDLGSFQYGFTFTNTSYIGNYNITIIANDTTNNINSNISSSFKTRYVNLKLIDNTDRVGFNNLNFDFTIENLEEIQLPKNKNIELNIVLPKGVNIVSNFINSSSSRFDLSYSNESLVAYGVDMIIHRFILSPILFDTGVLDKFIGIRNFDNSFNLKFNSTINSSFSNDELYYTGLGPIS